MNRTLQIWNDLRPFSVGFDNLFEHFDMHLAHQKVQTFPPYNIKKIDDYGKNTLNSVMKELKEYINISR